MYKFMWRYVGQDELLWMTLATAGAFLVQTVGITAFFTRMPLTYYFFGILLQFIATAGIRYSYRILLGIQSLIAGSKQMRRIMIVGAGSAGQMLLQDIQRGKRQEGRVICLIDDDPGKRRRYLDGVPVVGGREEIRSAVEDYRIDTIYIAMPSATQINRKEILAICSETDCKVKVLPGLYQFTNDEISVRELKDVSITDLLGRDPIQTDMEEVFRFLSDKTILVTGGGGSIGSELCRQIAQHHPKCLIIFDVYENNAYDIQMELLDRYPELNLVTLIGSVRDSRKLDQVFAKYRPEIVFHAAAHKHVPLMEDSPCEAIKNNAVGTYKTAYAALMHGCKRFVLISTDKAVNPTNIMGASKRLCEMVIQTFDAKVKAGRQNDLPALYTHAETSEERLEHHPFPADAKTEFVAVRFGNVLGSNGSVIPRFKKQIEAGGPVTVTHPEIIRYFMTIPEAVSLVLQAGTYAEGGEIFVLDMGSPVKIDTLARNLIKLSGLKPDVDIQIKYTGLRPGEKLFEEKLMSEEGLRTTPNQLIHIGNPIAFDHDAFLHDLSALMREAYTNTDAIFSLVEKMVSTYHPKDRKQA
ncbi:MAG: polysaccharide biosynthesis protein [Clostridia bacterium]|nr:polysaccharide biosynthesis protein [Clostridia bacterium]